MSKTELMEIGEHCSFCGQIDFLPFKCSCKSNFCSQHRAPEAHNCPNLKLKSPQPSQKEPSKSDLPSSASLFPDRSNFKIDLKTTETNPTTLKGTLIKNKNTSALYKLKKFFEKKPKLKKTINPSKKIIETAQLKSKAKGDSKVPISERIHLWIQVLDEESNIDKDTRTPVFISRGWPIGRALDSIATQLKLKNINNRTTDSSQRLFLFKVEENNFIKLNTSDRCSSLKDGDNIYVVRGTEV